MIINNWTSKRAGGAITIDGVNIETGLPVKITGISYINGPRIRNGEHRTLAHHTNGDVHELRSDR